MTATLGQCKFGELRSYVDDLAHLDLTAIERDNLLNEGYIELVTRAHYSKATLELGPSVSGTETYAWPAALREPLELSLGGRPYQSTDQQSMLNVRRGATHLTANGVWWIDYQSTAVKKIGVYPTGDAASILLIGVIVPDRMVNDDDEPICPIDFRPAIVDYVSGISLGRQEDLLEERALHMQEFERQVQRLRQHVNIIESGEGVFQAQIAGVNF